MVAFPSRGTRTLSVRGMDFRWHVSPKDVDAGGPLCTVQSATGRGRILHFWSQDFPSPKEACEAIAFALDWGWDPDADGSTLWVGKNGEGWFASRSRIHSQGPAP